MRQKLANYPGITFGFSQPIQDNVEEYVAGVKSSLVIKIFGDDLYDLERYANKVRDFKKTSYRSYWKNLAFVFLPLIPQRMPKKFV